MVVDLFAGPGGWDVAAENLGLTVVGMEHDAAACRTRAAAGHLTIRADASTYPAERFAGKVRGLIASPPCPDFSSAGKKRGVHGDTGHLIFEVPRWVEAIRPEWVACEQVPEVLPYWRDFARDFRALGYWTWAGVLCAADYGVPQKRYRAILMCSTRGPIEPMLATHAEHPHPSLLTGDTPLPWVSMAEGLGWGATCRTAPTVTAGGTKTGGAEPLARGGREALLREREREIVGYRRTRGEGMTERHGDRPDTPGDRPAPTITSKARCDELIVTHTHTHLAAGVHPSHNGTLRPVDRPAPTLAFGHNAAGWEWVVNTRQKSLKGGKRTEDYKREATRPSPTLTGQAGGFWQWERPATTVCADPRIPAPGYRTGTQRSLTPAIPAERAASGDQEGTEAIKLTVEEALILQGFDPLYPIQGSRTKKFEQIGNAIPPPFAYAVLEPLVGGPISDRDRAA